MHLTKSENHLKKIQMNFESFKKRYKSIKYSLNQRQICFQKHFFEENKFASLNAWNFPRRNAKCLLCQRKPSRKKTENSLMWQGISISDENVIAYCMPFMGFYRALNHFNQFLFVLKKTPFGFWSHFFRAGPFEWKGGRVNLSLKRS